MHIFMFVCVGVFSFSVCLSVYLLGSLVMSLFGSLLVLLRFVMTSCLFACLCLLALSLPFELGLEL